MEVEWERGPLIGKGGFGHVHLVKTTHQSQALVVKSAILSKAASLKKERLILPYLDDCPQIVHCFSNSICIERGRIIYNLFLEYIPNGTITDRIENCIGGRMREWEVRSYTKSILKGLFHIHQRGVVHCDIKPDNILLPSSNSYDVKIADFGLAHMVGIKRRDGLYGTFRYMAPESISRSHYDPPVDIWALGCVVVEMLTGRPAWRFPNNAVGVLLSEIAFGHRLPEIPVDLSEEGRDFLGRCFVRDPAKRWTSQMLLKHPFANDDLWVRDEKMNADMQADMTSVPSSPFSSESRFGTWSKECKPILLMC